MKKPKSILQRLAKFYGFTLEEVTAKRRHEPIATVRSIGMLLCHEEGILHSDIGLALGLTEGAIRFGVERMRDRARRDEILGTDIIRLRQGLRSLKINVVSNWSQHRFAIARARNLRESGAGACANSCQFNAMHPQRVAEHEIEFHHGPTVFDREDGRPGFGSLKVLETRLAAA